MNNKLLTLPEDRLKEKGPEATTVPQTFSHGRKRLVVVEFGKARADKPSKPQLETKGKTEEQQKQAPAEDKPKARKTAKKSSAQRRKEVLHAAKIARTQKALLKRREQANKAPPPHQQPPMSKAEKRKRQADLDENRKDQVASLAHKAVEGVSQDIFDPRGAQATLDSLKGLRVSQWTERDQRRYQFLLGVLNAVINGRKPLDITKPDGGYFKWPSTNVSEGVAVGTLMKPDQDLGVLRAMGYCVGVNALGLHERRGLLAQTYNHELILRLPRQYLNEWGRPRTSRRLQKLTNTIAAFTRNMKRRIPESPAIGDWEADLGYLKRAYYDGTYDFPWPSS